MSQTQFDLIKFSIAGHVATIELNNPPHNFFSLEMIAEIAAALAITDADTQVRSILLCGGGKSFCAGADLTKPRVSGLDRKPGERPGRQLYKEAAKLFRSKKPVVAAIHGPAIGGGLGLACFADFRVTCPEARFSANFVRLGFHPGFALTYVLPRLVGQQRANLMFLTGRRVPGDEAYAWGLAEVLVPQDEVRAAALALAEEIAVSAPLSLLSTRETLRRGFADAAEEATERELVEQSWIRETDDFKEGVKAQAERRVPDFKGE